MNDPLPKTAAILREGINRGQHLGAQLYVSLNGQPVADIAVGQARPGVEMTTDTLMLWMSMGKPVTAVLTAKLVDAGKLDIEQPVADFIPDFARQGKQDVTIAHLLTHSGGFRHVGSNWSNQPWEAIIDRIGSATLEEEWVVGETAGYHTSSSWYVLAEVARRLLRYEQPWEMYRREIFEPLDMPDCWIGMPRHQWIDYGTRIAYMFDTKSTGATASPEGEAVSGKHSNRTASTSGEAVAPSAKPLAFPNSEAGSTLSRPGGNARGPMSQLGRFYEQLLFDRGDLDATHARVSGEATRPTQHEPASNARPESPIHEPVHSVTNPPHFLSTETARLFTSCRRCDVYDKTFGSKLDWGYGFIINAPGRRFPYSYGPHASAGAFGHSGNQSTCAFADPAHGLVVCWATNGMPGELPHQRRQRAINAAVYEDLRLG